MKIMLSLLSNFWSRAIRNSAASLTLHENDTVHVQLTSGTSSSNREEERPPEANPLPVLEVTLEQRIGLRCIGFGWLRSPISINQESEDNIELFRCNMYLASHSVLCHCLVKQHSRNDEKKKKKIVRCQCTTKLTQVSSFSESHTSHGRARHQIRD